MGFQLTLVPWRPQQLYVRVDAVEVWSFIATYIAVTRYILAAVAGGKACVPENHHHARAGR